MDKFTDKMEFIEEKKFADKTKNEIYNLIKEKISIDLKDNAYQDVSIKGMEELTNSIYGYFQVERIKQEVIILENIKDIAAVGTLSFQSLNEHIDNLRQQLHS